MKDDGLAAGKGVVVTDDRDAALAHAAACDRVVIEEFLDGPEVSLFCVTDGAPSYRCCRPRTSSASATATPGRTRAGWARTPRCRGLPGHGRRQIVRTRRAADDRRDGATRARRSPACSTSAWRSPPAGRGSSSSTPASAIPRPRSCWRCSRHPWPSLLHAAATGALGVGGKLRWRDGAAVTVVLAAAGLPRRAPDRRRDHRQRTARRDSRRHPPPRRRRGRVLRRAGAVGDRRRRRRRRGRLARLRTLVAGIDLPGGQFRSDIALRAAAARSTLRAGLGQWLREAGDPQRSRRSLCLDRDGDGVVAGPQGRARAPAVAGRAARAGRPRRGRPRRRDRGVPSRRRPGHRRRRPATPSRHANGSPGTT